MTAPTTKLQNEFWNKSATKDFKDPFYLDHFQHYIHSNSLIIEYGCGYGRLLNLLYQQNYQTTIGFDFSDAMIVRGKKQYPHVNLQLIDHASIPLPNESADAAILSTVLCCIPNTYQQQRVIHEIERILKPGGALYFADFLITETEHMQSKYEKGYKNFKEWGVYQTSEGGVVRHLTEKQIDYLLKNFIQHWCKQGNFITMNNNPVKTFHSIYCKK